MQYFTVYFAYDNVDDLCVVNATTAEEAMAKAQAYFNAHADFLDTKVRVYKAVA